MKPPQRRDRRSRPTVRGVLAGVIVVLGVAVAWWWFTPSNETRQDAASTRLKRIREVTPAKAPVAKRQTPSAKPVDPNARPTSPGEYLNGYRMLANGRLHKVNGILTNATRKTSLADRAFTEESDLAIGYLLMARPGEALLGGGADYYHTFKEDFLESLKTPIVINADDDEDIRLMKEDVISIRKELKERYDRGEDLVKVMRETRDQLQELAVYKKDVEKMVMEAGVNIDNQKDYDDLIAAANQMLEERGSEPLSLPSAFKSTVREWRREARAAEEERRAAEGRKDLK